MAKYKTIKQRNAAFMKSNKARRRVMIAQDVVAQVESNRYEMRSMYLSIPSIASYDVTLNQALVEKTPKCRVCGIGGAFVSTLRLANRFECPLSHIDRDEMVKYLRGYFDRDQIDLFEAVFENHSTLTNSQNDWRDVNSKPPGMLFYDRAYLAKMMFQNIIDNKGTFIPELKY